MSAVKDTRWKAGQSGNKGGRPKGTPNKKTLDLQATCLRLGITPAEVMLRRMNTLWKRGTEEAKDQAVQIAAMVAPYIHPRLAAQQLVVHDERSIIDGKAQPALSSEAWEAEAAEQRPAAPAPKGGNGSTH